MTNDKNEWLAYDDQGTYGQPGSQYRKLWAGLRKVGDRYEMKVVDAYGSNQGHLEEHGRIERRYRHRNEDDLLRIVCAEIDGDAEFDDLAKSALKQAARNVMYDVEDSAE